MLKVARPLLATTLALALCAGMLAGASAPAFAEGGTGNVASSDDYGGREEISAEGMVAVTADQIADGTYSVIVETDTVMFNVVECQLTVKDGAMSAVLTLSSDGYQWLYMGTGEEAAAAGEGDYVPYVEDEDGSYTYAIGEVEALNADVSCCAYSKRRDQWYDHTIIFIAGSLPASALSAEGQAAVRDSGPVATLANGSYACDASVGTREDSLKTPVALAVEDGEATATLEWESDAFDALTIAGVVYEADKSSGVSVFQVPVAVFDVSIPVVVDTAEGSFQTTISFHSGDIQAISAISPALIVGVVVAVAALCLAAALLLRARRRQP